MARSRAVMNASVTGGIVSVSALLPLERRHPSSPSAGTGGTRHIQALI